MSLRRIVYLAHSIRSDWNNGNAHFLRGLLRGLCALGHTVSAFEHAASWSYTHLLEEGERGRQSLAQFSATYPELDVCVYSELDDAALTGALREAEIVIIHEWTEQALIDRVLSLREASGFRVLFHDTHHRASSSPEQLAHLRLPAFDGIVVFGDVLRRVYRERWGAKHVWTLHEAADTSVFHPQATVAPERDLVWVGNWGDGERTEELRTFLLEPVRALAADRSRVSQGALVYGVRYPAEGLHALEDAGIGYGGYLANLDAPAAFVAARCTIHVPRRQYARELPGIPTIRVFEALACGIPLVSAPWSDAEQLFGPEDFLWAHTSEQMCSALRELLRDDAGRRQRAAHGLATVRAKHTTMHRAEQLSAIFDEVLR